MSQSKYGVDELPASFVADAADRQRRVWFMGGQEAKALANMSLGVKPHCLDCELNSNGVYYLGLNFELNDDKERLKLARFSFILYIYIKKEGSFFSFSPLLCLCFVPVAFDGLGFPSHFIGRYDLPTYPSKSKSLFFFLRHLII